MPLVIHPPMTVEMDCRAVTHSVYVDEGSNRAKTSFTPVRNEADLVIAVGVQRVPRRLTRPSNPPTLALEYLPRVVLLSILEDTAMMRHIIGLLATLVLGILLAPLVGEEQQPKQVRIGYLSALSPSDSQDAIDAFRARLRDLGYVEGQTLLIESRYAEGRYERLPQLAADLVRLKVDVIFTFSTAGSLAAKNATSTIPIVFAGVSDPLIAGLAATLTRPGGNVTGVTLINPELSAKRLSLLKEAVPAASRVAVLANPNFPASSSMVAETRHGAQALGVEIQVLEVREPQEFAKAFGAMTAAKAHAVVVLPDTMFVAQRRQIVELAASSRIPAMYHLRQFVQAGGLISYGADYVEAFQQAARLVDKILKGAKPVDLPVEQPWRFALVINLKAAQAIDLTIPPSLLFQADEVIR
jgi:putative tryptophan/tyrosine transport system substrate-binding protein